jgi:hypothetical protein
MEISSPPFFMGERQGEGGADYGLGARQPSPYPLPLRSAGEQLSLESSCLPWFSISQDGVEDCEKLAHASHEGDFGGLAGGA